MGGCLHNATWTEAEARCRQYGARLCTQRELPVNHRSGCGHDAELVWVWEQCEHTYSEEHRVAVRFRSAMAPFHSDMRRGLDELTAHRDETRALLKRLAGWLGEDPNQANPDAILKVCADFIDTAIGCGTVPEESDE